MKKYSVNVHYDVVLSTNVIADSEAEAIDLAIENLTDVSLDKGEVEDEEGYVTKVEDIEVEEERVNPLIEELSSYRKRIHGILSGLVSKYGDRGSLDVFEFCSNTASELGDSTIDKILYFPVTSDLFFLFNANSNDYANINEFNLDELIKFTAKLQDYLEKNGSPE